MTCPSCGRDLWVCTDQATGQYYWCPKCHARYSPELDFIVEAKALALAEAKALALSRPRQLPFVLE